MKNQYKIKEEIRKTMESLDRLDRVEGNPFMFTRIKARLEDDAVLFLRHPGLATAIRTEIQARISSTPRTPLTQVFAMVPACCRPFVALKLLERADETGSIHDCRTLRYGTFQGN